MAKLVRKCYKCKEVQEISNFPKHAGKPLGLAYICKPCSRETQAGMYSKEEISLKNKKTMMKMKYGLTWDQYQELLQEHEYKCAICDDPNDLCVDHSHETGKVRGILCRKCNTGLGMFRDNVDIISLAQEYLLSQN